MMMNVSFNYCAPVLINADRCNDLVHEAESFKNTLHTPSCKIRLHIAVK